MNNNFIITYLIRIIPLLQRIPNNWFFCNIIPTQLIVVTFLLKGWHTRLLDKRLRSRITRSPRKWTLGLLFSIFFFVHNTHRRFSHPANVIYHSVRVSFPLAFAVALDIIWVHVALPYFSYSILHYNNIVWYSMVSESRSQYIWNHKNIFIVQIKTIVYFESIRARYICANVIDILKLVLL